MGFWHLVAENETLVLHQFLAHFPRLAPSPNLSLLSSPNVYLTHPLAPPALTNTHITVSPSAVASSLGLWEMPRKLAARDYGKCQGSQQQGIVGNTKEAGSKGLWEIPRKPAAKDYRKCQGSQQHGIMGNAKVSSSPKTTFLARLIE